MQTFRRMMCLALVLAAATWCARPAQAVEIKLLPSNTEIVITVNVKQILSSELMKGKQVKDLLDQVKGALETRIPDDRITKYIEKLEFDLKKDLHSITIAHTGSKDPEDGVLLIEGSFNAEKLDAVAKEAAKDNGDALRVTKVGKTQVYEIRPGGDKTIYVAHIGKTLVVTLNQDIVKDSIKRSTGSAPIAPKVRDLLKATNDSQSLSFVITGDALIKIGEAAQQAKGIGGQAKQFNKGVEGIEGVSGAITIAKNVTFQVGLGAKDANIAKDITNVGNFMLPAVKDMVAQKANQQKELAPAVDVMNSLKLNTVGNNVVLTGEITYANLEKMLKALGNLQGGF